jgi:hypothetical protein
MITLTFHWSSVDGVDLTDPLIVKAAKGSTFTQALQTIGKTPYDPLFEKEGYTALLNAGPKPITDYDNYEDLLYAMVKDDDVMNSDADLYYMMLIDLDSAEAMLDAPVCGTKTTTKWDVHMGWNLSTQTNKPTVSVPGGTHFQVFVDEDNNPCTWWVTSETKETPFRGTFKGVKDYMAKIWLEADYGYWFNEKSTMKVNGVTPLRTFFDTDYRGVLGAVAKVTAVHDLDEGETICGACGTDTSGGSGEDLSGGTGKKETSDGDGKKASSGGSPKTGDENGLAAWITLFGLSALALSGSIVRRQKTKH